MALVLNDDEKMLHESAAGFFADNAPVSALRALRDTRDETGFSPKLWQDMTDMGFAGILVPEEQGGVDMGYMAAGLVAEQMGRNLTASAFLSTSVLAVAALKNHGSDAQKSEFLTKISAGDITVALAIDEGRKHNPAEISLSATASGNGFKLSGSKTMVIDGHIADHIIVAAKTDVGPSLFLLPADSEGVTRTRVIMLDSRNSAHIEFDNVEVTGAQMIGPLGGGEDVLSDVLNAGRAVLAAEMLGAASQVFELTTDYLKERKQFGRIIGEFQALQHRAAHLYCELEIARSSVYAALTALDIGANDASDCVAKAKAKLGCVARLVAVEAVQLHGGMGMTDELDIGLYLKRIRAAQELFGDSDFHMQTLMTEQG